MRELQPTSSRIRTRFIAVLALITSGITFGSGFMVFLYMKSPAFENQLLGQVMKHMNWLVARDFVKLIEKRNQEYIEWETKCKWEQ
tara:strand:+ start:214 stop:471 length:258 start_codon:yes stop_codon:yes gene_type:complete